MQKSDSLVQQIKSNPLPYAMQVAGVLVLLLNLYLASQLAPLAQGIGSNEYRISAIENDYVRDSYYQIESEHIEESLMRIETKIDRIEDKLDLHLNN